MSVLAPDRLTLADAARMLRDAVLDHTWENETLIGPIVVAYLNWKRLGRAAPRTIDQYERDLAKLCVELSTLGVADVGIAELMLVLQKFPPGSWKRVRSAWSGFFHWTIRFGYRTTNPMDMLPDLRPEPQKVYDLFSPTEKALLLKAQDESLLPERDRAGSLIFQELGVRKNEARLLRVDSFDLVARTVVIHGKGRKERVVPFSDDLWRALMDFLHTPISKVRTSDRHGSFLDDREPRSADYLFFPSGATGEHGNRAYQLLWADPTQPMSATAMHGWWKRCILRADVRYRSLHMNRHTVGTELVDADIDAFSVRDWLGHADTRTTEVYVHNSRRRLQKAAKRLEQARQQWEADDAF